MPVWCDIEKSDEGEIIIRTRLIENEHGELVPMDDV
jgi:hypothetical protein